MARTSSRTRLKTPPDLEALERIARRAPKQWRSQRALREAGFRKIPGGAQKALAASRRRRLTRRMQQLRKQAGLTRAQVARRMGISAKDLATLEDDSPGTITLSMLEAYARAIGADVHVGFHPAVEP